MTDWEPRRASPPKPAKALEKERWQDGPGHCLRCGTPLKIRAMSAYCSRTCKEKGEAEDYWEQKFKLDLD